ncbi:hypothetical protein [Nocardia blacklockiae]|uniref:hypothetical protein n=1 Tax=Nocardia blacklockiae TaxID=480036 RepID=UPI001894DA71|nr:hypothetical protein [Nocardia blacklockiae]MBF6170700.1 hypothetical protein [Nocardia blacklockiae]
MLVTAAVVALVTVLRRRFRGSAGLRSARAATVRRVRMLRQANGAAVARRLAAGAGALVLLGATMSTLSCVF